MEQRIEGEIDAFQDGRRLPVPLRQANPLDPPSMIEQETHIEETPIAHHALQIGLHFSRGTFARQGGNRHQLVLNALGVVVKQTPHARRPLLHVSLQRGFELRHAIEQQGRTDRAERNQRCANDQRPDPTAQADHAIRNHLPSVANTVTKRPSRTTATTVFRRASPLPSNDQRSCTPSNGPAANSAALSD